jgi:lipopolysaccharide biosynthesis regulator YciM
VFLLVATDYAKAALACERAEQALAVLQAMHDRQPSLDLLRAMAVLDASADTRMQQLAGQMRLQPSLSAAQAVLQLPTHSWTEPVLDGVRQAVAKAARPLQRYRCAACGFEAQHYFWQCPGCLSWDSYPPLRIEEL